MYGDTTCFFLYIFLAEGMKVLACVQFILGTSEATIGGKLQRQRLRYECLMYMRTKSGCEPVVRPGELSAGKEANTGINKIKFSILLFVVKAKTRCLPVTDEVH